MTNVKKGNVTSVCICTIIPEGNRTLDLWLITNTLPLSYRNMGFLFVCFCWRLGIRSLKVVESGSAYGAFACERALRRIKVGRYLLTFQSPNLVHLRRKLMNKLCQSFLIKASTFLSNSSHHSSICFWASRKKYSLSHYCPDPFNGLKSSIFGGNQKG